MSPLRQKFEQIAVRGGEVRVQVEDFVDDQMMVVDMLNYDDENGDEVFEDGTFAPVSGEGEQPEE